MVASSRPTRFVSLRSRRALSSVNRAIAELVRRERPTCAVLRHQHGLLETFYMPAHDIWLASNLLANMYRNGFGAGVAVGRSNLHPSVQLNIPLAPGSARPHARFLRDADGRVWVAHCGTLGGRQSGISRAGFLTFFGGARTVIVDDAKETLLILGAIDDRASVLAQIARLTHTAKNYREALAAGFVVR